MKFGKIEDASGIKFILPEDDPNNITLLNPLNTPKVEQRLFIGSTSWSVKEWKGLIYPAKAKTADFLDYYGQQFNTIELNTTHYRIPTTETLEKWREKTPQDFIFCPKILQTISHSRDLGQSTERFNLFLDAASLLDNKLGPCFMQLPPYFKMDRLEILESFLSSIPKGVRFGIEFRNEELFSNGLRTEIKDVLLNNSTTAVITDVAGRRDVLHQSLFSDYVMIRFVANDHSSDYQRIDQWIETMANWYELGMKQIFFFIHTPSPVLTPKISVYLSEGMHKTLSRSISRAPKEIQLNKSLFTDF